MFRWMEEPWNSLLHPILTTPLVTARSVEVSSTVITSYSIHYTKLYDGLGIGESGIQVIHQLGDAGLAGEFGAEAREVHAVVAPCVQ